MLACKLMTRVLGQTNRQIITNLPLNLPEIRSYMAEHWPGSAIENRITIITETKLLKRFWLCLGNGWFIPDVSKEDWNKGFRLDYRKAYRWLETPISGYHRDEIMDMSINELKAALHCDPPQMEVKEIPEIAPIQFIIDELQNIFPSRSFMQTSPGALFWLSQQRKLGADFIGITQHPDTIDKEFRDLADDYLFITNWGRKQKSFFRLPKMMTWSKYDQMPRPGVTPMVSGAFAIDVQGIGKLYDTSAGVGIEGSLAADTKEKIAGFHWSYFIIGALVVLYLLTYVPGLLSRFMGKAIGLTGKTTTAMVTGLNTNTTRPPDTLADHSNSSNAVAIPTTLYEDHTNLTGFTLLDGKPKFLFRNKVLTHRSPGYRQILHDGNRITGVQFNNTNYFLAD